MERLSYSVVKAVTLSSIKEELEQIKDQQQQIKDLCCVFSKEQQIKDLFSKEQQIKDLFLKEQQPIKDETKLVQNWLKDLKVVADDLLDDLVTESSRLVLEEEQEGRDFMQKKQLGIKSNFSSINTFKVKMSKIADELYETGEKLRSEVSRIEMAQQQMIYQWKQKKPEEEEVEEKEEKENEKEKGVMAESFVFGRDEDIEAISNRLLSESYGSLPVISIYGMGGLGKTTLARSVYDSERVQNGFDFRVWVSVEQEFKVGKVISTILESTGGGAVDAIGNPVSEVDHLIQTRIQQLLRGKKFLIVLDDVWSLDHSEWDALSSALQVRAGSAGGSKILVTTRNQSVASIMGGTNPPYNLKHLGDEDCWSLFKQIAFAGSVRPSLANSVVRSEIIKRCGGLPLASKALGSLLRSKADENEWCDVTRSSREWVLLREDMNSMVLPVLKLSYDPLPEHLKQCFVYCSLFPEDFRFDKDEMVLLWMAEGFVCPDDDEGGERMEDIAASYFEELLSRSLFEASRVSHSNGRPMYKMHYLIHDLARSLTTPQGFFLMEENNSLQIPKEAHRSSLLCKQCGTTTFESFYCSKGLHTLLLLGVHNAHTVRVPHDLFLQLKMLRVLDLSHTSLMDVPNSIGNLLQLRYLNLSLTHVKVLPDSMSRLYNLQTLRLSNCSELVAMPRGMGKLTNLRHLQLESVSRLFSMPANIGRLTSLQTLTVFVVGRDSGHRIGELKELMELRGELRILKLENVVSLEDAEEAMLQGKKYLHKLELRWTEFQDEGVEAVLKGLQPPSSLTELRIVCYGGSQFPSWMADPKFLHLVSVSLYSCLKCQLLPPLGQLPRLKYLRIDGMDGVKNINHDFCGRGQVKGFPKLEMLVFKCMTDLEEWQGAVEGDMPMLRELKITSCSKLRQLPELIIFKDLQNLEISLCPELPFLPGKGMPAMLRSLTITNCPQLKQQLQNAVGKDWHKMIAHIPNIWID